MRAKRDINQGYWDFDTAKRSTDSTATAMPFIKIYRTLHVTASDRCTFGGLIGSCYHRG